MQTDIDYYEIERQFTSFTENASIPPPREGLKLDGKIHRFDIDGKKQVGAYQVWPEGKSFDGKPHGWVQDHRDGGDKHFWQHKGDDANTAPRKPHTPPADAKAKVAAEQADDERKKREGLQLARADYEVAAPVNETSDHPYLVVKQVPAVGPLRCGLAHIGKKTYKDTLLIPCHDIATGELVAVHRVFSWRDESGKFQKGWYAGTYGGAFTIAEDVKEGPVIVCEGIATGLSLYDATKYLTIASMDAGNLAKIAPAIRAKYPDRKIFIASDDDDAGKKAAKAALAAGFDGELCPPFLPEDDRPPRWNGEKPPTDWNDYVLLRGADVAGNVIEGLIEAALTIPEEAAAKSETDALLKLKRTIDTSIQLPQLEVIAGMFPRGGLSFIVAKPGVGKTWVVQRIASDLSIGGPIFDGYASSEPRTSVILAGESGYEMMIRRATCMRWPVAQERIIIFDALEAERDNVSLELDTKDGQKSIRNIIRMFNPDILFIDSLMEFHSSDESKSKEMRPIFNFLNGLAREANVAIVISHHVTKSKRNERKVKMDQDDVIGSSMLIRYAASIIGVEETANEATDETTIFVSPKKSRGKKSKPFSFQITEDESGRDVMRVNLDPMADCGARDRIWSHIETTYELGEWFSSSTITDNVKVSAQYVRRCLNEWVDGGMLEREGTTRARYCIPNLSSNDEESNDSPRARAGGEGELVSNDI